MIDLTTVTALAAVHRTGTVIAAAAELGYTPSAVSQQIKRLEGEVGGQLLERVGRNVVLTQLARHLLIETQPVLDRLERLGADLASLTARGPAVGTLKLASFSTGARGIVAPALARLRSTDPDLRVELIEEDPHRAIELVASGGVDVALVHNWGTLPLPFPDHLEVLPLGVDRADILVSSDHPFARRSSVRAADLLGEIWICPPPGSVCHVWLTHLLDTVGGRPDIRHWSLEFSTHIVLVEHGAGISLVPRLGREPLPRSVVAVDVTGPPPTRRIMITWRRSMSSSPAIARLRDVVAEVTEEVLDRPSPPERSGGLGPGGGLA